MGGASGSMMDEEQDFEIYKALSKQYEEEYLPKIKAGGMTERDAYLAMKAQHKQMSAAKAAASGMSIDSDDRSIPWDKGPRKVFQIGDVVRVTEFEQDREGVVLEMVGTDRVIVDFGDSYDEFDVGDCKLLVKSEEFELGDKVQINDGGLFFLGNIQSINKDRTYDVLMIGDDPDDIERGVRGDSMRKVMTNRSVATARFRKASLAVIASTKMWKQIKFGEGSADPIAEGTEEAENGEGEAKLLAD